jgi:hypothetical protein
VQVQVQVLVQVPGRAMEDPEGDLHSHQEAQPLMVG